MPTENPLFSSVCWKMSISELYRPIICPLFFFLELKFLYANQYFSFFLLIYLFLAVLGLRFCARAFSSCGKRGPLFIAVRGPLTIAASLVGSTGSVVVAHGPSCSTVCGIFPDQGLNPCPLHWQVDSQPLRHRGNPCPLFFKI